MSNSEYKKVVKIAARRYRGKVYNLRVAGNEMYVVEGIVVHNCPHHASPRADKRLTDRECRLLWAGG